MENPAVLLVHTEYGSSQDETSPLNQQVVDILRERESEIPVLMTVLKANEEDIQNAKRDGIELLLPTLDPDDPSRTDPSPNWLTFDHLSKYQNLPQKVRSIVGHSDVTSRAAVRIKQERYSASDARVVLFTTDIPEDTEYYKGDEKAMGIGKKEDSILEDAQEADVVFSLGNKIFDHFENQFRAIPASKRPQHVKFVPRPPKIFEDAEAEYKDTETMVVLSIGRVKGVEKLKGYDLAVESLSLVAEKMKVKLRVMGVDKDDIETRMAILKHRKSANLQITLLPYGSQKDIYKEMMQAHLVLMPSRAEPFGLVGLEAIAAGVPVLVSSKSGLADFIHEHVDELHHSIVDMDEHEEGVTVKYLARSIERMLKHNRTEFETAARCKKKLLSSKYWEESHQQCIKACTDADIPPPLPIVVEILAQVKPTVKTPKELLSYASAKKAFVTLDITTFTDETLGLLEQVKPEIRTVEDLLDTAEAIKQLEEIKGVNVTDVKTGSLVFYTQCTDLGGLGQLWFMYKSGKLNDLLVGSLIRKETLQELCAENVSVKSTINIEDFRKALVYILTSPAAKGQLMPRLPLEYPLYQPHTRTTSRVLDVLHLDQKKLPQHLHKVPLPTQRNDGDDDLLNKLDNLQIAASTPEETPEDTEVREINSVLKPAGASVIPAQETTEDQTIGDTEVPQVMSELVSLDIKELERLMGPRRKRTSSISSDSSGYVTGTPGSGLSRPDSPSGEGDVQGTLETLLAELNKPAVLRDKGKQFDLYCQIGDLYRTKLRNPQSALQYYQNMLECSQALSEDTKQAKAYSRLGVTCDILGLQAEAFTNHEKALAIYRVDAGNETDVCIAYKNLASSLALSGQVSDAKINYESALAVAMETGNKTEQMGIYCMLGDLHMEQLEEPEVSHRYYTEMLTLARDLRRKDMEGLAYNRLGRACSDMQNNDAALEWHQKSLEMMSQDDGNKRAQMITHAEVGNAYRLLGKPDQATSHFNTALQLAQQTGDQHVQMSVCLRMGEMHREQLHSPRTAIQHYKQTLALARQLKDRDQERIACNRLGLVHYEMGEYGASLEWGQKNLQIVEEDGNKEEQITAHNNVGNAYRLLSKLDLATSHFNTALQMAQQTGDQHWQMKVHFEMGDMHREQLHSPRTAVQYYEQALALAGQLKARHEEGVTCNRLGQVHFDMEEYESALEWFQRYLQISQEQQISKGQITAHNNVGNAYRLLGKLDLATSHLNTALQMAQQTGDQHWQMKVYFVIGEIHRKQLHSPSTAIQHYEQALALARRLKDRHEEGKAYGSLGLVHFEVGEYETSLECLHKYLNIKQEDGEKKEQIVTHTAICNVYSLQGHLDLAASHLNTALQMARQTGYQHGQMKAYFMMGDMHKYKLHSPRTAIQYYKQTLALARQLKDKHHEGLAYERLGMAHFEMGEHEAGLRWLQKASKIREEEGVDQGAQGKTHSNVDRAPMVQYLESRVASQNAEEQRKQMNVSFQIGEMFREQIHSPRTAIQYYEQHLALARQLKDRHEEGLAYDRLGRAHFELKEYDKALLMYQNHLKMRQEDRDKKSQTTAHKNIAKSYKKLGKKDLAKSQYQSAMAIAIETGDKLQQDDIRKKINKL
ncbi:PREDICTED: LOW QUALITY PROTEIN: uncharacterized protein LOC109482316 [Branchiostoma belcheri]|uniref:LOW QUALITY PROTEIN: uncharacterized protein LOC109482316 n=1 Tax=Branchiostoma belcheri TaxID=7741 RepID=A0A6P4ZUJ5_BRABE|nr:PREDICTED: LOW QUALITY PROTEIN: uncharacterized protein LOC109482316 [Branchiostoma belcheri]